MTDPIEFELNRIAENKHPLICLFINDPRPVFCTEWTKTFMQTIIESSVQHNTIQVHEREVPAPYLVYDEDETDDDTDPNPDGPKFKNHTKFVYTQVGYNLARTGYCGTNGTSSITADDNLKIAVCIGFVASYVFDSDPAEKISAFNRHVKSTMRKLCINATRSGILDVHFEYSLKDTSKKNNNNFVDSITADRAGIYAVASHLNTYAVRFVDSSCDIGDHRFATRIPLI